MRISDKYELYLFHLFLGVIRDEMLDLARFGIPPIGVGQVTPLDKEPREKILDLVLKIDVVVKDACVRMIEESASATHNDDETRQWIKTIIDALKRRASLLMESYGMEMGEVEGLLHEIEEVLDRGETKS